MLNFEFGYLDQDHAKVVRLISESKRLAEFSKRFRKVNVYAFGNMLFACPFFKMLNILICVSGPREIRPLSGRSILF